MSQTKKRSREMGVIGFDEERDLFDDDIEHLRSLTCSRTDFRTGSPSGASESECESSCINVVASGSVNRSQNQMQPPHSTNTLDMILDEVRKLRNQVSRLEEQNNRMEHSMEKLTRLYRLSSRKIATKPTGFPLATVEAIRSFEHVGDEDYSDVVNYCVWLSGSTPRECANLYVKHLLTDRLVNAITWTGSHGVMALKGTRIVQAFEEAMNCNRKFPRMNRVEFANAMKRALHCAKERVRKLHSEGARRKNGNDDSENDEDET